MRSRRHRRLRPHNRAVALVIILTLVVVLMGGCLGYALVRGASDQLQARITSSIQAGQQDLEAGKASLQEANAKHDGKLVAQAIAQFADAETQFNSASRLADQSRLLYYLEMVPPIAQVIKPKHAAVDGVAAMGVAIARAGEQLSNLDGRLIQPPTGGPAGQSLLAVIDDTNQSLAGIQTALAQAQSAAATVALDVLPAAQQQAFTKARDAISAALAGIDEFARLVPVMKEVLGGNGARTYLLEQVNPAELRSGGGFIGTYTLLRADHGALSVVRSGDSYDLANPRPLPGQPGFIPQPTPYRDVLNPNISFSFVDSNIYPDFPSNAKSALKFVEPRIGNVDGVISIDFYAVAKMLELTGPLAVPGFGLTVDASNFIAQAVKADIAESPTQKAILAAMAGPLMARVLGMPPDQWPTLLGALNTLASQRHLQAYFKESAAEQELDRIGWSGSINPTAALDFFMDVEANYWGDKSNYYLTRHFTITLTRSGSVLHHTVTVNFRNDTPYGSYVRVDYGADVRLFMASPLIAATDNLRQPKYPNPSAPPGTQMLDGWVIVPCCAGQETAVFQYDTAWSTNAKGVHQIYWQKQPGTIGDQVDAIWIDATGRTYKITGAFDQDQIIGVGATGITLQPGRAAQAILPTLNLG